MTLRSRLTRLAWALLIAALAPACDDETIDPGPVFEPDPRATIRIAPVSTPWNAGDLVTLKVTIESAQDLHTVAFRLSYPDALLDFVPPASQGSFLSQGGRPVTFSVTEPTAGDLVVSLARDGASPGALGNGNLASFTFRALQAGTATFAFSAASLADPEGGSLPSNFVGGSVAIGAVPAVVSAVALSSNTTVGQIVSVEARIENASNVDSIQFHLTYPENLLEFIPPASEGSFLLQGGRATTFTVIEAAPGDLVVSYARDGNAPGALGAGLLAVFTFQALQAGTATLAFSGASLKNPAGAILPSTFTGTSVGIAPGTVTVVRALATPETATIGSVVTIEVRIENAGSVAQVVYHLRYNATLVDFEPPATEGPFLAQGGNATSFDVTESVATGELIVEQTRSVNPAGASGSGSLATFRFRALQAGRVPITWSAAAVRNPTGTNVPASFVGTSFAISP